MGQAPNAALPVLAVTTAGRTLAIDARQVKEVAATPAVTRVPQTPGALKGLINLRGEAAPLLSLGTAVGLRAADDGERRTIVMARADPIGVAVDSVADLRMCEIQGRQVILDGELVDLVDFDALIEDAFAGLARRKRTAIGGGLHAPQAETVADLRAFMEFSLCGQAYALPLSEVVGVLATPPAITDVSLDDPAMVGVIRYRGAGLPLVDLAILLGFPANRQAARLVVIRLMGLQIGLLVDRLEAILRIPGDDIAPVPSILNRGKSETRIDAIAQAEHGLVGLLATHHLFDEPTTARLTAMAEDSDSGAAATAAMESRMEQFVLFRLGGDTYGLPASAVGEIIRRPDAITPAPHAPAFVAGLMNYRGRPTPLIDQRLRFDAPSDAAAGRVIITRLDEQVVGFIVDAVEQVVGLPADAIAAIPDLARTSSDLFDRVAKFDLGDRIVLLIDPQALVGEVADDLKAALSSLTGTSPG